MTHQYPIQPDSIARSTGFPARTGNPVVAITFALWFVFAHCAYAQSQSTTQPVQRVIPVNIDATTGNITVGTTVYAGANPGMNMVALTRSPSSPGVISPISSQSNQTFADGSSANEFLQNVLTSSPDAIIILNAVGNYGFGLNAISDNLHKFGAAHDIDPISTAIPFIFIGNGGLTIGQAHQCGGSCSTTGYFATDSNTNYTFIQPDYVTFHITMDGIIKIGTNTYTVAGSGKVAGCNGTNGFHVVVVQRDAPQVLIGNESYCTASNPTAEFAHLHNDLSGLAGSESNLVFIASSGHPIPADWNFGTDGDYRVYPVAQDVAKLGGYWETMVYLKPADTYSLVGAAAPPSWVKGARKRAKEASSVYPDHPTGELHGALARGLRGNWYSPVSGDLSGLANLGFYEILALPPAAFPVPDPANQDQVTQFNYIGTQLHYTGNLRNGYTNTDIVNSNWYSTLLDLHDPTTGNACPDPLPPSATAFCVVRAQLLTEFFYVGDIQAFANNLGSLVRSSNGAQTILDLLNAQNTIVASLPAPPSTPAPSLAGPIVNLLLGVASLIPEAGPVFGLADTLFNFGTSLTTDTSGNQTINLSSTVANLAGDAANHFSAETTIIGTQFDFIYQDWGKINALGAALASGQAAWAWNGETTTGQVLKAMNPAIQQSFYQSLMAAIYAMGSYYPGGFESFPAWGLRPIWQQPAGYIAYDYDLPGQSAAAQPFNYPYYHPYTFPGDTDNLFEDNPASSTLLADTAWLGISSQNTPTGPYGSCCGPSGLYVPPADSILTTLFTPVSQGGLGVYRPAFFESWPFPRVICDTNYAPNGGYGSGCDWGSAAPPPEALPAPITSISIIKPAGISRNGTRVDLSLKITNNGTTEFRSLEISEIALRTAAGAGEATLVEPGLPVHIGKLLPGSFIRIALTLNVPHSVNKLELTESGTVENGESSPYNFSIGQVIFPKKEK